MLRAFASGLNTLAVLAQDEIPPATRARAIFLTVGILVLGLVGIMLVIALLKVWRRSQRREHELELARQEKEEPNLEIDAWQSASHRMEEMPASERPDSPFDDEDDDDTPPGYDDGYGNDDEPDDDDGDAPWRQSL